MFNKPTRVLVPIYLSSYRILAPHPLYLPLRSLISIVTSGEGGGGQNPTKENGAPLSLSLR